MLCGHCLRFFSTAFYLLYVLECGRRVCPSTVSVFINFPMGVQISQIRISAGYPTNYPNTRAIMNGPQTPDKGVDDIKPGPRSTTYLRRAAVRSSACCPTRTRAPLGYRDAEGAPLTIPLGTFRHGRSQNTKMLLESDLVRHTGELLVEE